MPNRQYQKGYRTELELVNKARAAGLWARRTAGSKGPFDVHVTSDSHQWLVDVKCNVWAGPDSREAMRHFISNWTTCVLASRVDRSGWYFRLLNPDGTMGLITREPPWQSLPS